MKNLFLATAFTIATLTTSVSNYAFAGEEHNFELINEMGVAITHFYASPNNKDDWEEDILGKDVLEDGYSTNIDFKRYSADNCIWDVKLIEENGKAWVVEDINLCEIEHLSFKKEDGKVIYFKK